MAKVKKRKPAKTFDGLRWRDRWGHFTSPPKGASVKLRSSAGARKLPKPRKKPKAPKPVPKKRKAPKPTSRKRKPLPVKRKPVRGAGPRFKPVPPKPRPKLRKADIDRQVAAAERLRFSLRGGAAEIAASEGVQASVSVAENRDGTIDGEMRIYSIPRSLSTDRLLLGIEAAMWNLGKSPHRLSKEFWMSVGGLTDWGTKQEFEQEFERLLKAGYDKATARHEAQKARSPLPRYKGLGRVAMYPQRADNIHVNMLNARKRLFGPQVHRRHKPEQILIRVYWNPDGKKPGKR